MPGVYREQPSRRAPEPDPRCADDYDEIGSSLLASGVAGQGGGAKVANFEYQRKCPNAQNLIAIIGDGPDPDRVCDSKCNLQIQGMGRRRARRADLRPADEAQRHPRRPRRRHPT